MEAMKINTIIPTTDDWKENRIVFGDLNIYTDPLSYKTTATFSNQKFTMFYIYRCDKRIPAIFRLRLQLKKFSDIWRKFWLS